MKNSRLASQGNVLPTVLSLSALVLVIGAVVVLILTGFLKVNSSVSTIEQTGLCNDAVTIQNAAYAASSPDEYSAKLAESAKSAASVQNNQSDPNCVFIQFTNALYTKDNANIDKFSKQLRTLYDDGKYVTGQLTFPLGINDIEQAAQAATAPAGGSTSSGTQGNG
jgi:hypothetical protein